MLDYILGIQTELNSDSDLEAENARLRACNSRRWVLLPNDEPPSSARWVDTVYLLTLGAITGATLTVVVMALAGVL
jgi:hypothetical protein